MLWLISVWWHLDIYFLEELEYDAFVIYRKVKVAQLIVTFVVNSCPGMFVCVDANKFWQWCWQRLHVETCLNLSGGRVGIHSLYSWEGFHARKVHSGKHSECHWGEQKDNCNYLQVCFCSLQQINLKLLPFGSVRTFSQGRKELLVEGKETMFVNTLKLISDFDTLRKAVLQNTVQTRWLLQEFTHAHMYSKKTNGKYLVTLMQDEIITGDIKDANLKDHIEANSYINCKDLVSCIFTVSYEGLYSCACISMAFTVWCSWSCCGNCLVLPNRILHCFLFSI